MFALVFLAGAQVPLTNETVVKMVKQQGLSEDVVLSMVKTQPAQYTITLDELAALKADGVPDKVVAAMVEKAAGGSTRGNGNITGATTIAGTVAKGDPNDPMSPHDSGIYLNAKDRNGDYKLIVLEQASYQGSKTGGMAGSVLTVGLVKATMKAVIPGQHASIRTPDSQPLLFLFRR
jgi:hypothetical protein